MICQLQTRPVLLIVHRLSSQNLSFSIFFLSISISWGYGTFFHLMSSYLSDLYFLLLDQKLHNTFLIDFINFIYYKIYLKFVPRCLKNFITCGCTTANSDVAILLQITFYYFKTCYKIFKILVLLTKFSG